MQALAVIGDVAHPAWRARAVGSYGLWRDGGFAAGALLAGALADASGITTAIRAVAALTAASGLPVADTDVPEPSPHLTPDPDSEAVAIPPLALDPMDRSNSASSAS